MNRLRIGFLHFVYRLVGLRLGPVEIYQTVSLGSSVNRGNGTTLGLPQGRRVALTYCYYLHNTFGGKRKSGETSCSRSSRAKVYSDPSASCARSSCTTASRCATVPWHASMPSSPGPETSASTLVPTWATACGPSPSWVPASSPLSPTPIACAC